MAVMSDTAFQPSSRPLEGMTCLMIGMVFFVVQDALMKTLLATYPVWMLIGARATISVMILVPLILYLGRPHRLLTPLWPLHLIRATLFAVGFCLFYTAFPFMGLAEVTTIFFSAPLMTALLAAVFLRETIGLQRGLALVIGFIGVLIAMRPGGATFQWVAVLPLICAFTYALSQIVARKIGDRESTLTVGLYTLAPSGPIVALLGWSVNQVFDFGPEFSHLRFEFPIPDGSGILWLAAIAGAGMMGYILNSRAYQVAPASLMAPFDYSYLPMAAVLGYLLWGEVPPVNTVVGMALIVASGVFIGYREIQTARRAKAVHIAPTAPFVVDSPDV
ncbi:DMT family transporter [Roseovarius nubinhibens]|uniref:DMT family transporter n=1 Tax=Roseovarius nubinhibens TaxID=314263 RepID=UPI001C099EA8|nr:DMT family transporter [Roseovarius nubinhibens]MBU2998311.1 DMT family transporter [Roseovarius nubinhibens]